MAGGGSSSTLGPFPPELIENYTRLRRKLILFFERRHASGDELADETLLRLLERLAAGTPIENLEGFAFGIAKHVYVSSLRYQPDPVPNSLLEPLPPSTEAVCLGKCLDEVRPDDRELLEAYFLDGDRTGLAERLSISLAALRKRIWKLKGRLRTCIARCADDPTGKRND